MKLERAWSAAAESARVTDPGSPDSAASEAPGFASVNPAGTIWADALPSPLEAVAALLGAY